ncbi:hypothetical protein [Metasolibacillus sp.]|uniref:hypothetical protein n=1 Tax=Metasolibacillus sp. TaxID=2703680 RepID=UPI0025ED68D2|nr:hypothetical protein [Metasolibacillus sp.]MCT6922785.1 hypothetical protein [Metasolibacillus sp.]MCT6938876.1 hypothetical protein [Metasolibacillus sp.]
MLNILKKISEKKCENCGVILQKDGTRQINLKEFELINYDKALREIIESPRPSYLIKVLICESCHITLEQIVEKRREIECEAENRQRIRQQKKEEEQRYLDALRKQVELKTLEKQAVELGINLKEL